MTHKSGELHIDNLGDIISNNLEHYIRRQLDKKQRRELTILSGQTCLNRRYSGYHFSAGFFLGLIEITRKEFVRIHQLDYEQVRELRGACAKLCIRWARTTFCRRANMAFRFILAAMHYKSGAY